MSKLILLRHGQSKWNEYNIFTGWVDVPLSTKGVQESLEVGQKIKDYPIDVIFTSTLIRAQMTAMLAMSLHSSGKVPVIIHHREKNLDKHGHIYCTETNAQMIPVICASDLNERMYGELQGCNKAELAKKFGKEQIQIWRRSYDIPPPNGESLQMTAARSIPYFEKHIVPHLQKGENVFVVAHGNSLRSIMMKLDHLTSEQVVNLELATGDPIIYDFQENKFFKQ